MMQFDGLPALGIFGSYLRSWTLTEPELVEPKAAQPAVPAVPVWL